MHLHDVPLMFVLAGLVLYVVLAGADFGAGFWELLAGGGERGEQLRERAHESMAPVWEANHVWLIFVLTITWTAYPTAFGAIASTLSVPLFIAAIGIVLRGGAYAMRAGSATAAERRRVDLLFAVSSVITPFALGTVIGAIASRRVPVGNAAGAMFTSWLNPTSILVGALAVAVCAYLAAVFLAADALRAGQAGLTAALRSRALAAGGLTGALALAGLLVVHSDAQPLYRGLLEGDGLPALIVSALAGASTLGLVWSGRFEPARYTAAAAVAAVVGGWALAQQPTLLPGLSVAQAAAPHDTLVAVVIAVALGGAILFPSLGLLFRLALRGRFDSGPGRGRFDGAQGSGRFDGAQGSGRVDGAQESGRVERVPGRAVGQRSSSPTPAMLGRLAAACLVAGVGFLTVADAAWAHAVGVVALVAFMLTGFAATTAGELDSPEA